MIDWTAVLVNAVWILGASVVLATCSYFDWWRGKHKPKLAWRVVVADPRFQAPFGTGMALFSGGLALAGNRWWSTAAWATLALVFGVLSVAAWRATRNGARRRDRRTHE